MFILFAILVAFPAASMGQAIDIFAITHEAFGLFSDVDENNDTTLVMQEVDDWFHRLDLLNIGNVTHAEFADYVDAHFPDFNKHEGALYDAFDFNHDTFLTMDDVENLIEQADKNNDDLITQSEFIAYAAQLFMGLELLIEVEDYLSTTPAMSS